MQINLDSVPATFDQAVEQLVASLSPEDRDVIRQYGYETDYHFSAGMAIRNNWSLWKKGTPFDMDFRKRFGLSHGDDKSGLLFVAVIATVLGHDVQSIISERVDSYRQHWLGMGLDPLAV